ncbi:MAG: hypothetical protein HC893_06625 [Chloroflexaceae bacterium]|nr:hypothetical protein [Chloroflexaceae bacterium]
MLGLNDVHIAHMTIDTMGQGIAGAEKSDVGYVLDQQPHFIPLSTTGNLLGVERFEQEYTRVEVDGPRGGTLIILCALWATPPPAVCADVR